MGRIHAATQTIVMRPDPWGSSDVRAPRWTPRRARRSAGGKIFARTDETPAFLPAIDGGPLKVPCLKVPWCLGALASVGAGDL
eukprot:4193371-Pyramimonas_sp.AAC.1